MLFEEQLKLIKKNMSALLISEVLTRLMMLVFTIILARAYGKEQFGLYALALSIGGLFEIIFNMGLNTVFLQRVIGEKKPLQEELSVFLPLRIILSVASYGCFVIFIFLMGKSPIALESLALGGLYYTIASIVGFLWACFDARQKMQYTAGIKFFQYVIIFGLGMYFTLYNYPIGSIVGTYVISIVLAGIVTVVVINRYFSKIKSRVNITAWKAIIKSGWPIALSGTFVFMYNYLDTIIISLNQGEQAVGLYQVSYKIIGSLFILSSLINQAYFPSLIESHTQEKSKLITIFDKALKTVFFWSIPISVGGVMLGERIILFVFGPEYAAATTTFTILIWNCIIFFCSSAMASLLYALGKQRQTVKVFFIGALVNTALNLYIIPRYGIEGAAITTILAEIAVLIGVYVQVKKEIDVNIFKSVLLPLFCSTIMALALRFINFESLILMIAMGGAIYFATYFGISFLNSRVLKK